MATASTPVVPSMGNHWRHGRPQRRGRRTHHRQVRHQPGQAGEDHQGGTLLTGLPQPSAVPPVQPGVPGGDRIGTYAVELATGHAVAEPVERSPAEVS